jgi:predicted nuclease with RNAse H fold
VTESRLTIIGLDLAARVWRPTGVAVLTGGRIETRLAFTDDEITGFIADRRPQLVAIDAPLSLPAGRCCLRPTCDCRRFGISRRCDRELVRLGFRVFWTALPSMVELTRRGITLAQKLRAAGFDVIEVFPGAAQQRLGLPRKQDNRAELARRLAEDWGLVLPAPRRLTHHELDAATAAIVGLLYLQGRAEAVGDPAEGQIILPSPVPG